jgi:hypothetical protein
MVEQQRDVIKNLNSTASVDDDKLQFSGIVEMMLRGASKYFSNYGCIELCN